MPLDSTRLLRREAYFYPPDPPDPLGLPVGVSASRLVDGCRLGFLWIEVVDPDPERALALAVDSRAALSSVLGAPDTLTRLLLGRRGLLGRRRPLAGLTSWSSSTRPIEPPGATRVFLAAAGAISGISLQWDRHIAQRVGVDRNRPPWSSLGPRIPEMMALADLGTEAREPFRASFALIDSLLPFSRLLTEEERLDLVEALEGWLAAATNLPPERRAAALVAGDLLLSASMAAARLGDPEGTQVRERLERQGAEFQFSPLENAYGFTHPWLNEAVALDPGGPAGDAAFLRLMEMGFETSVACGDQGGAGFRAVIEQGEKHLRERPGSPREAEIRFLLAEAYSDIVGLANGPAYQDSEDTLYVAEAPHAREHAIQEYRLAFSLAAGSARAADSWENAWRLMAGLTPTRTFFYCVYD